MFISASIRIEMLTQSPLSAKKEEEEKEFKFKECVYQRQWVLCWLVNINMASGPYPRKFQTTVMCCNVFFTIVLSCKNAFLFIVRRAIRNPNRLKTQKNVRQWQPPHLRCLNEYVAWNTLLNRNENVTSKWFEIEPWAMRTVWNEPREKK